MPTKKIQLGKLLLDLKLITQEQFNVAMAEQLSHGKKLGQILIDMGFIKEEELTKLLAEQLAIPYIDLRNYEFDPTIIQLLPESYARRFRCIPLRKEKDGILLGMSDPQDVLAHDEVSKILKLPIYLALVNEAALQKALDVVYRHAAEISNLAEQLATEIHSSDYDITRLTEGLSSTETPVAKLLQTIFEDAVQVNASDVHIEPDENVLRIRHRVDGILHEQILKEKNVSDALSLRLKLMARLNIAEKRIPQDGRFSIKVRNKNFDVRLSTLPTQYGESVVMRLLNQSAEILKLDKMGMPENILLRLHKIMTLPNGVLLITGPTGSGKTTTLYGILSELNKPDTKIITVEDPIEYRLPRITQVQVQAKIDLSFSRVLRASLRQDPDIIMVGELRDQETVSIALRAAMTGHFVFSTLHTNDSISTVARLIDMGAEDYLVATTLRAVIAQRLVRRICQNCSHDYTLTPQESIWLSSVVGKMNNENIFKYGAGCTYCHQTGYSGQIAVYELLEMNELLANALLHHDMAEFARIVKSDMGFQPLVLSGLDLAKYGITTLSEVIRITGEIVTEDSSNIILHSA
jgi:MSHA biogenesis protein MshE